MAKQNEWRPIKSAPKDGTRIIGLSMQYDYPNVHIVVWQDESEILFAGWYDAFERSLQDNELDCDIADVRYWMPLPTLPKMRKRREQPVGVNVPDPTPEQLTAMQTPWPNES